MIAKLSFYVALVSVIIYGIAFVTKMAVGPCTRPSKDGSEKEVKIFDYVIYMALGLTLVGCICFAISYLIEQEV